MDDRRFDEVARTLRAGASRRSLLAGLGAIAGGALIGREAAEAKRGGNGKSRGKKKPKVSYCHKTGDGYVFITVSGNARGHARHGDVACAPDVCKTYTGDCDDATGACLFAAANEGQTCRTEVDPDTGETTTFTCQGGECLEAPSPTP